MEGRLLLSASSEGEDAFESPQLEHGVFTHFLLRGLDGAADLNEDFHVTVWELYEYVAAHVTDFVNAERGEPQHPQLLGEGETRIILSVRDRPLKAEFAYCPAVPYVGGPVVFTDETASSTIVGHEWSFGDGASGTGKRIVHTFRESGTYAVLLGVADETGDRSETRIEVHVGPSGQVIGVGDALDRALISLGARNGVRVGDRFAIDRGDEEDRPILEVFELLDEDRAVCRIVEGTEGVEAGVRIAPVDAEPCAPPE